MTTRSERFAYDPGLIIGYSYVYTASNANPPDKECQRCERKAEWSIERELVVSKESKDYHPNATRRIMDYWMCDPCWTAEKTRLRETDYNRRCRHEWRETGNPGSDMKWCCKCDVDYHKVSKYQRNDEEEIL